MYSFSIIIPTYNSEKWISKCLDSILNQNYDLSKVQVLVIDDGSTDNICEVLKKYKKYKWLEYHRKTNGQWGSVINYAKNNKLVKNELVLILDADDFLVANSLKIINNLAIKKPSDIYVGSFWKWNGIKKTIKIHPYWFIFKRKIKNKVQMNTPVCLPLCFFVKKEIFYKTKNLTEKVAYQDPDYISQLIKLSNSLSFTKKTIGLYYYNRSGNSVSQKWDNKRFEAEHNACLKCIDNDAIEIVSYRLNIKGYYDLCKKKEITFKVNRKLHFSWFPFYIRPFYVLLHFVKYRKFFKIK